MLRSTPWLPATLASAAGNALLVAAALAPASSFAFFAVVIGLATCGAAAAYLLDEESAVVLDATPASRSLRTRWRLVPAVLPLAAALTGLAALDRADGSGQWAWLRIAPLACGAVAAGTALAALLRHRTSTPGDVAAAVTLTGFLLLVATNPLRHWAPALPVDAAGAGRSALFWASVVLAAAGVVVRCSRDPARS